VRARLDWAALPSHPIEIVLLLAALGVTIYALLLRERVLRLEQRLALREREGHFLGESPDALSIVRHAHAAAGRILPVSRFELYRVDDSGAIEEAWTLAPEGAAGPLAEPALDPASPYLGKRIDPQRLRELTATETGRSFAPRELLAGGPPALRLRLPLYAGDRLVAHLEISSPEPIDDAKKQEVRALLGPLTASLGTLRNWTIAVTDELSGLASRRYFETRLSEEWARRERYGSELAVALFDLDRFKALNDSLGHAAGDRAIRRFGEILRAAVRVTDVACRYGGEEFAVLFPASDAASARAVAERVRLGLAAERFEFDGAPFRITVSTGIAEAPAMSAGRNEILFRADKALYLAKERGRNRVEIWREDASGGGQNSPPLLI
jgi:diguanylate cyclase (GGDEF)-like protein